MAPGSPRRPALPRTGMGSQAGDAGQHPTAGLGKEGFHPAAPLPSRCPSKPEVPVWGCCPAPRQLLPVPAGFGAFGAGEPQAEDAPRSYRHAGAGPGSAACACAASLPPLPLLLLSPRCRPLLPALAVPGRAAGPGVRQPRGYARLQAGRRARGSPRPGLGGVRQERGPVIPTSSPPAPGRGARALRGGGGGRCCCR